VNAKDILAQLTLEDGSHWLDRATDWQLADAMAALDGEVPFGFTTRPRGGSKTTDCAGVAIAWLLSAAPRSRFYGAAADRDQARLLLDGLAGFAQRTPSIGSQLKIEASRVTCTDTGSTFEAMAADAASSWGIKPAGVVIDELGWWPDVPQSRELLDSLLSSAAKVKGCRVAVITSPSSPSHFSFKLKEHADEDPLWRLSEQVGPPPWLDEARVEEQKRRLSEPMYQRLFEGRWVEAEGQLADAAAIAAAVDHDGPNEPKAGKSYAIGLDLGLKRDRSVATVCHREGDRIILDRIGVWKGTRAMPVQLDEVEGWLQEAARTYNKAKIVADPWQSVGLLQRLKAKGIRCEEYPFTAQSVGRLASTLFGLLRDRRLSLIDDDELIDELRNVRLIERGPGQFRLDHAAGQHDDRAVSLALAAQHLSQKLTVIKQGSGFGDWNPEPSKWGSFDRDSAVPSHRTGSGFGFGRAAPQQIPAYGMGGAQLVNPERNE